MAQYPVLIVDHDENRRRRVATLLQASTGVKTGAFTNLATAFPGFRSLGTSIFPSEVQLCICAWDQGGEALILERIALAEAGPALLLPCEEITPTRISMARRAGNVHLVPADPADLNALMTRAVMILESASPAIIRPNRLAMALQKKLAGFPALQRRLSTL
jgi:hypothetical protein